MKDDNAAAVPAIHAAMIAVMRDIGSIEKDQINQHQRFKFRGIDQCYNALHGVMAKHGVYCTSRIIDRTREERANAKGTVMAYVTMTVRYTFNAADGSSVSTTVIGEAMDSGDKASPKALAIAHKYALLQAFMIPTEEQKDPDAETHEVTVKKITADQYAELGQLATDAAADTAALLRFLGVAALDQLPAHDYARAKKALEVKIKQRQEAAA